jgi:hypothetical protein
MNKRKFHNLFCQVGGLFVLAIIALADSSTAFALGTVGSHIENTATNVTQLPYLFSGISYLFGIVLGAVAIGKLYEHVQAPHNTSIWESIKRFVAGGGFFALPTVIAATYNALTGGRSEETAFSGPGAAVSPGGLDAMVVNFVRDIWEPMFMVMGTFCYLAGVLLVMVGISRMLKTMQEGPRGPAGIGTIMTFVTAGALLSIDTMLSGWLRSIFGSNNSMSYGELAYTGGMTGAEVGHVNAVMSAVVAFVAILGVISFIRGWFIIRSVAEGGQASLMAGMTHLFGGALAVNLGGVINMVQETLGISDYGVVFAAG